MTRTDKLERLIREMVQTFEDLGCDHFARIDARLWHKHYHRRAAILHVMLPVKEDAAQAMAERSLCRHGRKS